MPAIHFIKNLPSIEVPSGAILMESLLKAGLPVASSCLGDGICGKCRLNVIRGGENLSQITAREQILRERLNIPREARISCQTQVLGDVTIDASYW